VRTPRSFSALAMFCRPLTPAAGICRTIGSTFAAKVLAVARLTWRALGLRLGQIGAVAGQCALCLFPRQRQAGAVGYQAALHSIGHAGAIDIVPM
jgi:hypothetical protein